MCISTSKRKRGSLTKMKIRPTHKGEHSSNVHRLSLNQKVVIDTQMGCVRQSEFPFLRIHVLVVLDIFENK